VVDHDTVALMESAFGAVVAEHPLGAPGSASILDEQTGPTSPVDRWDTGLVGITGDQGLLAQVNGRNSQTVIDWLAVWGLFVNESASVVGGPPGKASCR
jgi:hypothetical protein